MLMLIPQPREAVLHPSFWRTSPPVPRRERPVRVAQPLPAGATPWRLALDALPNTGARSLDYDSWRNVIFAIHHETGGSDEGLALATAWSSRSEKFDLEFLENRVWPYIKPGGGVTGGTIMSLAARLSKWQAPIDVSGFGVIEENGHGSDLVSGGTDRGAGVVEVGVHPPGSPVKKRQGIPKARHLCTDQANANRLLLNYGSQVLVAAGKWHVWDGMRWKPQEAEADVYRFACRLGAIIKDEAKEIVREAQKRMQADGSGEHVATAEKIAEALEKWSAKSEMKGAIEAAVGLVRKMLTVDASLLDANPWLLNCRNGVVDLRTGVLSEHRPELFMTKLVDLDFDAGASSELWERTVLQITREDTVVAEGGRPVVAEFLRRWFGYCATGDTREQVFVVHWGDGSNGKSTLLDTVARVLGDYAGLAAPGLVAGGRENHPTEVADLRGRRMVTASETKEGVQLNEDFIKRATGDAMMKARFMREDFFEFPPTHKIQLLTNSKPTVRGQDHGIWRRVRLVAYGARFGTAEEVAKGFATAAKNMQLLQELAEEAALQGVLAWVVRGAVEWVRDGGLRAPDAVIEASAKYKGEQDRVGQFVEECCEIGAEWEEPIVMGMTGLYPGYVGWCKESGFHELARGRFVQELCRVAPVVRIVETKKKVADGPRRSVFMVQGLRLLPD